MNSQPLPTLSSLASDLPSAPPTSPHAGRRRIKRLPSSTTSLLRSTLTLPQKGVHSLSVVLSELVQNALDAKAKQIEVWIKLDQWSIGVADDGVGFGPEIFNQIDLNEAPQRSSHRDGGMKVKGYGHSPCRISRYSSSKGESYKFRKDQANQDPTERSGTTSAHGRVSYNNGASESGFGARGEALASIADLAVLDIQSQPRPYNLEDMSRAKSQSVDTQDICWSLIMKGQNVLYAGRAKKNRPQGFGSTVWARDLFYNLPVRRKALSRSSRDRSYHPVTRSLLHTLTTLALVHPEVSFSATLLSSPTTTSSVIGTEWDYNPARRSERVGKLLMKVRANRPESFWGRWQQLFGKAGVENVFTFDTDTDSTLNRDIHCCLSLKGFFSLTASHSKLKQHIYVNGYPVPDTEDSVIHHYIRSIFARSTFSKYASSQLTGGTLTSSRPSSPTKFFRSMQEPSVTKTNVIRRTAETHPIYMLNVITDDVDICWEPDQKAVRFIREESVTALVREVVAKFLSRFHYVHASDTNTLGPSCASDAYIHHASNSKDREVEKLHSTSVNDSIEKSGCRNLNKELDISCQNAAQIAGKRRAVDNGPDFFRTPTRWKQSEGEHHESTSLPPVASDDQSTNLADIKNANESRLDRSALLRVQKAANMAMAKSVRRGSEHLLEDASKDKEVSITEVPLWLTNVLQVNLKEDVKNPELMWTVLSQNWENPVFPVSIERPISAIVHGSLLDGEQGLHSHSHCHHDSTNVQKSAILSSNEVKGSGQVYAKEQLKNAEFVAQVDRKFLLVRLFSRREPLLEDKIELLSGRRSLEVQTLVMMDQHAADERVKVEKFLSEYCGAVANGNQVKVSSFKPPKAIVISGDEATILEEYLNEFARWGLDLRMGLEPAGHDFQNKASEEVNNPPARSVIVKDYVQVYLYSVPHIVAERLNSDETLVQELIRSHLALLRSRSTSFMRISPSTDKAKSWSSAVKNCPSVIIDLINSKACRSAIMFNDELTRDQCVGLLSKLASTTYPFQCAHGRPSIFPLTNLPTSTRLNTYTGTSNLANIHASASPISWERFASR